MLIPKINILNKLNKDPNNYKLNLDLGMIYVNEKDFTKAKFIFKKLIQNNKNRYEGFLNLSNIYAIYKKYSESEKILKNYLKKNGYNKEIITGLASIYYQSENYKKLNILIDQNINQENNHILFFLKSIIYEINNETNNQISYLKKSIEINNIFWVAYEKLFNIYEKTNKIDELDKLISFSDDKFINEIKLYYYKAVCFFRKNLFSKALDELNSNKLEDIFKETSNDIYLANLYDLLSKIYLKIKKFDQSLFFAIKRNSVTLKSEANKKFKKDTLLNIIKKYQFFYQSSDNIFKSHKNVLYHDNITFLVGFPRSGTTLLDTILRSHSKTLVLEEKPYLINLRHKFFKENTLEKISLISSNQIAKLQKEYFNSFDYSKDKLIIDKFPLNLIEMGFIKKIFPKSKIILAIRHPLDCILSCVLTSFKINEAMANYENLQTSAFFYNEVFKLFKIYENNLKLNYHLIKYENLVNEFDSEIKNLLSYLEIEYEENILNYQVTAKNRERINTPSYHQVIKPIYNSSINRYQNFDEIEKIKSKIDRWIKEFNY